MATKHGFYPGKTLDWKKCLNTRVFMSLHKQCSYPGVPPKKGTTSIFQSIVNNGDMHCLSPCLRHATASAGHNNAVGFLNSLLTAGRSLPSHLSHALLLVSERICKQLLGCLSADRKLIIVMVRDEYTLHSTVST